MSYSGQARIAFDTGFNDALFGRPRDNPYDQAVVGKSWQAYEEGYEEGLISDTPPRGPKGDQGEKGDPGPQGPAGADGSDGAPGGVTGLSGEVTAGPGVGVIAAVIDPSAIDGQTLVGSIVGTDEILMERGSSLFKNNYNQMTAFFQTELTIPTDHTALTSIGVNTHAQIDTHIADTANPHNTELDDLDDVTITAPALNDVVYFNGVDWENIGAGILGGSNNLDGGASDTNYGGTVGIDGGDST